MFSGMSRRERLLVLFLSIFAVIAIYYYFLYTPMLRDIDSYEQEINSLDRQITSHLHTLSNRPELEARYSELKYLEDEELGNRITSIDELLKVLEDESVNSGIKLTSFVPTEEEETTKITMTAEGNFSELVLFLEGISSLNGKIEFDNINVKRKNEEDNHLDIRGNFIFHYDLLIGGDQN